MPVTTPSPVTSALPCPIAESHISRRLRDFLRFRTFGGCKSGERDGDAESAQSNLAVYAHQSVCAGLFSGTGWSWGTPRGPPPHAGSAVHSNGNTALHAAAWYGNRRIVRLLIASQADVNAQDCGGCAFPFRHRRK